jgi:predicted rRNA methylase YqxC with S4 and FtsJ domains
MFSERKILGENGRQDPRSGPVRGYTKLSNANSFFGCDFREKVVLDIGSSTGGFTKYALEKGAKKVIAVEKGTNQMMSPLRFDPRIDLREKTDIFTVSAGIVPSEGVRSAAARGLAPAARGDGPAGRAPKKDTITAPDVTTGASKEATRSIVPMVVSAGRAPKKDTIPVPDIVMADVSFISLTKVLAHVRHHLADEHTEFLVMLKPQFEAGDSELRDGVVKNEKIRRVIIKGFENWLKRNGFLILKKRDNTLKGKTGNTERFYYLKLEK